MERMTKIIRAMYKTRKRRKSNQKTKKKVNRKNKGE